MKREGSDNPRFKVSVPPLAPGQYRVRGEAEVSGRTLGSQAVDFSVSDVSVEFQRVIQDRSNLRGVARQTGGAYVSTESVGELGARIPLRARIVEAAAEVSLRTSAAIFIVILALLSFEWIIRKRVGMI
jgi:hypothetical protein